PPRAPAPSPPRRSSDRPARFPPRPSAMAAAAGTASQTAQAVSEPLSTLAARCRHPQDSRKSRFLAIAEPVTSPTQALAFLREVRSEERTSELQSRENLV